MLINHVILFVTPVVLPYLTVHCSLNAGQTRLQLRGWKMSGAIGMQTALLSAGRHSSHSHILSWLTQQPQQQTCCILSSRGSPHGRSRDTAVIRHHLLGGAHMHACCTQPVTKPGPPDVPVQCQIINDPSCYIVIIYEMRGEPEHTTLANLLSPYKYLLCDSLSAIRNEKSKTNKKRNERQKCRIQYHPIYYFFIYQKMWEPWQIAQEMSQIVVT